MLKTFTAQAVKKNIIIPEFKSFELGDAPMIQNFVDQFAPKSCEYNFANLFVWQYSCKYSWVIYKERLVIYDAANKSFFMPLGEPLSPAHLTEFSLAMLKAGLGPDISLVQAEYLDQNPEIASFYTVNEERDLADYFYSVERLCELNGTKLHKKRNLISQFKRQYPDFSVEKMSGSLREQSIELANNIFKRYDNPSKTLVDEQDALAKVFDYFDELGFEGLVLLVEGRIAAFSIFTRLNNDTYDIQFEKSNQEFKGAAQVINQETAKYLRTKCRLINREQDLGIKGLRQAKLSYEPDHLLIPSTLKFHLPN
ncbi:MAG: DUF2156 domain-containing protein [Desulfobacteraceae bacterium]|nr:DUF2156 domain-containing protein [Desulfobacteraceae bacterium]